MKHALVTINWLSGEPPTDALLIHRSSGGTISLARWNGMEFVEPDDSNFRLGTDSGEWAVISYDK